MGDVRLCVLLFSCRGYTDGVGVVGVGVGGKWKEPGDARLMGRSRVLLTFERPPLPLRGVGVEPSTLLSERFRFTGGLNDCPDVSACCRALLFVFVGFVRSKVADDGGGISMSASPRVERTSRYV